MPTTVYVAGVVKSIASYTLHMATVDQSTGVSIASQNVPSSVAEASKDVLLLGGATQSYPTVVWVERDCIKARSLLPDLAPSPTTVIDGFTEVVDVQLATPGYFVALRANKTASIFGADATSKGVKHVWEFTDSVGRELPFKRRR